MAVLPALVGQSLLNLLLLGTFGVLVFFFRSPVYTHARWIFLVAALIAVYAGGAKVVEVRMGRSLEDAYLESRGSRSTHQAAAVTDA